MKPLLTGFEPFGGSDINPSEEVAHALHGQTIGQLEIVSTILPADGDTAPTILIKEIASRTPDAILCMGEASRRSVILIERVALNLKDDRITDNHGNKISEQPVRADGPAAYFSTLPIRDIHNRLITAGIPVELSLSAGSYLCNRYFIA